MTNSFEKLPIREFCKELETLSVVDLKSFLLHLQDSLDRIKDQIGRAKSKAFVDGVYSDSNWYHSAVRAKSAYTRKVQAVQQELSRRKVNRTRSFERAFVEAARRVLDKDTYLVLLDAANAEADTKEVPNG